MKKKDVLAHYEKRALACEAAGVKPQNWSQWGFYLPEQIAAKLAIESRGLLVHDRKLYMNPPKETVAGVKYTVDMDAGLFARLMRSVNGEKSRFFIIDGEAIEILPWSDKKDIRSRFHNHPVYFKDGGK